MLNVVTDLVRSSRKDYGHLLKCPKIIYDLLQYFLFPYNRFVLTPWAGAYCALTASFMCRCAIAVDDTHPRQCSGCVLHFVFTVNAEFSSLSV